MSWAQLHAVGVHLHGGHAVRHGHQVGVVGHHVRPEEVVPGGDEGEDADRRERRAATSGSTIVKKTRQRPAPSMKAASSSSARDALEELVEDVDHRGRRALRQDHAPVGVDHAQRWTVVNSGTTEHRRGDHQARHRRCAISTRLPRNSVRAKPYAGEGGDRQDDEGDADRRRPSELTNQLGCCRSRSAPSRRRGDQSCGTSAADVGGLGLGLERGGDSAQASGASQTAETADADEREDDLAGQVHAACAALASWAGRVLRRWSSARPPRGCAAATSAPRATAAMITKKMIGDRGGVADAVAGEALFEGVLDEGAGRFSGPGPIRSSRTAWSKTWSEARICRAMTRPVMLRSIGSVMWTMRCQAFAPSSSAAS